ncbi:uncharacterized protein CANTADRAFT_53803, partial [Suhomyces tanzawaensis NRRL Y-17324]
NMYAELLTPQVVSPSTSKTLSSPPGFGGDHAKLGTARPTKQDDAQVSELKAKRAWELAIAPAKSLPMTAFMSYMTGNSLQIIPMTMAFMLLWNPIKAIFTETNALFKNLSTKDNSSTILQTKLVYVVCQLLNMAVGVYKLSNMGLIPNREADWLAWKEVVGFKESLVAW